MFGLTKKPVLKYLIRLAVLGIGLGMVVTLIIHLGPAGIWGQVKRVGWSFPLIFLPYAVLVIFDNLGWAYTFLPGVFGQKVTLARLYLVRLAGESINSLTPTASLGGEPVKAAILRRWDVPGAQGMASVVIDKTMLAFSQIPFLFIGLLLLGSLLDDNTVLWWVIGVTAPLAVLFILGIVTWQKQGLFTPILHLFRWLGIGTSSWEDRIDRVDSNIRQFYRERPDGFVKSAAAHFIAWLLGVNETMLLLWLIGAEVSWTQAIVIESLSVLAKGLGQVIGIPGGVGVQEGGGVVIFRILGLPEATGMALILLKRVRELFFTAIGLCLLSYFGLGGKLDQDAPVDAVQESPSG